MEKLIEIFDFIWGIPLTIFVVLAGIYFSKNIHFIQITKIKSIINNTIKKNGRTKNDSYKTILSVLGGTVGAGNVAGIATAIAMGGPGAIFWMWIISLFSMATKMVEVSLAVKNHKKDSQGNYYGGSMFYIKKVKGLTGRILSVVYIVALLLYVLCDAGFVQVNTVSTSLIEIFNIPIFLIGLFLVFISFLIIKGGLKRISNVLVKMVPSMCIFYLVASLIVILINLKNIPMAFLQIIKYSISPAPIIGGFAGATVVQAISKGAARGIFANEAGTGTSTTVHATSTNTPIVQGLWGMVEVAFVSFIVCSVTALLIMTTNSWTTGLSGAPMILNSFESVYGVLGKYILCFVIVSFAYSTYIGFYYEFITCLKYLFKEKYLGLLKWIYLIPVIIAVFLPIEIIWTLADISVGFILIPNIVALFLLRKEFKKIFLKEKNILN